MDKWTNQDAWPRLAKVPDNQKALLLFAVNEGAGEIGRVRIDTDTSDTDAWS